MKHQQFKTVDISIVLNLHLNYQQIISLPLSASVILERPLIPKWSYSSPNDPFINIVASFQVLLDEDTMFTYPFTDNKCLLFL